MVSLEIGAHFFHKGIPIWPCMCVKFQAISRHHVSFQKFTIGNTTGTTGKILETLLHVFSMVQINFLHKKNYLSGDSCKILSDFGTSCQETLTSDTMKNTT